MGFAEANGFDTIDNPAHKQNWGYDPFTTAGANLERLAFGYEVTGDAKYLETIAGSMHFGLGMNPDNMAQTTGTVERGLAFDEPDDVLHADGLATDQDVDGITIYGFYSNPWNNWGAIGDVTGNAFWENGGNQVPLLEIFNDFHNLVPAAEYTIHQSIDTQIYAWGLLAGQAAPPSAGGSGAAAPPQQVETMIDQLLVDVGNGAAFDVPPGVDDGGALDFGAMTASLTASAMSAVAPADPSPLAPSNAPPMDDLRFALSDETLVG